MESWKPQEGIPRRSGNGPYAWSSTTARSTSLNGPQCALSHLSYDNALAESVIGLYKTELIRGQGPWKTLQDVKFAPLEWVDWFNHRRLFESIGNIPPAEREEIYYTTLTEEEEEGHGANESPVNPGRFIAPPQRGLTKQGLLQRGGKGGCLGKRAHPPGPREAQGRPQKMLYIMYNKLQERRNVLTPSTKVATIIAKVATLREAGVRGGSHVSGRNQGS